MYEDLIDDLAKYSRDPLGFVMWAFPWGESGTDLWNATGPEQWQAAVLTMIRDGIVSPQEAVQIAVRSGHGVGKSALVAWIILWAISTFPDTRGVVTANTETQLKTKTWVELATWFRRFIAKDLFKMAKTSLFSADPDHEDIWRIDQVPWSERNTEAFAGMHNKGKRIVLIMDEASAIPDLIWEVSEGALTDEDTEIIWCAFGNPTRNKGRFFDAHEGRFSHRWRHFKVDSRTVSFTNKALFQTWIDDYGDDSDFVRVRVLGEFPRVDAESFIPYALAMEAVDREVLPQGGWPLILGVDVGRFGDDPSVIYPRRGRDGASLPVELYHGLDLMQTAAKVAEAFNRHHADITMVDEGGLGAGVVDRLRQLRVPVLGVNFGSKPQNTNIIETSVKYANKRAEIWGEMKSWLVDGAIHNIPIPSPIGTQLHFIDELTGPTYGLNDREEILLERKKDMRSRGVPSPNVADALACTFAAPAYAQPKLLLPEDMMAPEPEYDPFDLERIYAK